MSGSQFGKLIGYRVSHRQFLLGDDPAALDAAKAHADELAQESGRTVAVWPVYGAKVELDRGRPILWPITPSSDDPPVYVAQAQPVEAV